MQSSSFRSVREKNVAGLAAAAFRNVQEPNRALIESGPLEKICYRDNSQSRSGGLAAIPPMRGDFNVPGGLYRHFALTSKGCRPNSAPMGDALLLQRYRRDDFSFSIKAATTPSSASSSCRSTRPRSCFGRRGERRDSVP
jgi:hypothetical protein